MNENSIEKISEYLNQIKGKCQLKDRKIAEKLSISTSELNCLKIFIEGSIKISVKDLAERLNITSGGVTKIVGQLEEQGILRRDMDPEDRRGILVSLTSKGRSLINKLHKITNDYYTSMFSGLPDKEKEKILSGLESLNEVWGKNTGDISGSC
ncbi:MAG: MarR family winged helix-turn-helix transcriptional regulator [Candidatus Delongbacteria bacterium]